jgi:hypothetical protein
MRAFPAGAVTAKRIERTPFPDNDRKCRDLGLPYRHVLWAEEGPAERNDPISASIVLPADLAHATISWEYISGYETSVAAVSATTRVAADAYVASQSHP